MSDTTSYSTGNSLFDQQIALADNNDRQFPRTKRS